MVLNYKRKTSKVEVDRELILTAVKSVLHRGAFVHGAVKEFGLNYKSLGRYVNQVKSKDISKITIEDIKCSTSLT